MGFDNPPRPWREFEKLLPWRETGPGRETSPGEQAATAKHYGVAPGTVQRVMRKLSEENGSKIMNGKSLAAATVRLAACAHEPPVQQRRDP